MSYLPRAPTRGAAPPLARRDVTTPLPRHPQPEFDETNLAYKPSRMPLWATLKFDSDGPNGFYSGRSVQICGIKPIEPSPTQHGSQNAVWRGTDHDTLYRFQKRVKVKTVYVETTPFSISHMKLLPERPSIDKPRSMCEPGPRRYRMNKDEVFYLSEKISIDFRIQIESSIDSPPQFKSWRLEVPMYTGVTLSRKVSLNRRAGDAITDHNVNNMYYEAEICVVTEDFGFEKCRMAAPVTAFESLDRARMESIMSTTIAKPGPRVVSAEKIALPDRRLKKNVIIRDLME